MSLITPALQVQQATLGTAHSAFRPVAHGTAVQPAAVSGISSPQRKPLQKLGRGRQATLAEVQAEAEHDHRADADSMGQDVSEVFQAGAELGVRERVLRRAADRLQEVGMTGSDLQLIL